MFPIENSPFVWDMKAWLSHVESVLVLMGEYEGDRYTISLKRRDNDLPLSTLPWIVRSKDDSDWMYFRGDMESSIRLFTSLEKMPEL